MMSLLLLVTIWNVGYNGNHGEDDRPEVDQVVEVFAFLAKI